MVLTLAPNVVVFRFPVGIILLPATGPTAEVLYLLGAGDAEGVLPNVRVAARACRRQRLGFRGQRHRAVPPAARQVRMKLRAVPFAGSVLDVAFDEVSLII
jgi:hypothetical protein